MPAVSVGSSDLLATPRTDTHLEEMVRLTSSYAAHPDFARDLERENARMRAAGQNLRDYLEATPVAGFDIPDDIYKPFIDALANVAGEPRSPKTTEP